MCSARTGPWCWIEDFLKCLSADVGINVWVLTVHCGTMRATAEGSNFQSKQLVSFSLMIMLEIASSIL